MHSFGADAISGAFSSVPAVDRSRRAFAPPTVAAVGHTRKGIALDVRAVGKRFGGVQAVVDVAMTVREGEIRAIIGPNGAGKSTLLNLISGLYAVDAGSIRINGGTRQPRAKDLARLGVARTFQNLALLEGLSVARNVAMGRRAQARASVVEQVLCLPRAHRDRHETRGKVDEMLAFFDLEAVRDRRLEGLPYGVLKRVELARALVAEPRLLLLDEPLAGMDGSEKTDMARLICATRDGFDTTVVLIEHDVDIVMRLADRLTVLDHGRKIAEGTPDEIRANPAVIAAYFGQGLEETTA